MTLLDEVTEPVISEINLDLKSNDFLVVVGKVGAGKSTLLHAIMEEVNLLGGE